MCAPWHSFYSAHHNQFLVTESSLHLNWHLPQDQVLFSIQKSQLLEAASTAYMSESVQSVFLSQHCDLTVPCVFLPPTFNCTSLLLYYILEQSWITYKQHLVLMHTTATSLSEEDVKSLLAVAQFVGTLSQSKMIEELLLLWIESPLQSWDMTRVNLLLSLHMEPITRLLIYHISKQCDTCIAANLAGLNEEQVVISILRERRNHSLISLHQCAEFFISWTKKKNLSMASTEIGRVLLTLETEENPFSPCEKAFLWDHFSSLLLQPTTTIATAEPSTKELQCVVSKNQPIAPSISSTSSSNASSIRITFMGPDYFKTRKEAKQKREKLLQPYLSSFQIQHTASTSTAPLKSHKISKKPTKPMSNLKQNSSSAQTVKNDEVVPKSEDLMIEGDENQSTSNFDKIFNSENPSVNQYLLFCNDEEEQHSNHVS